MKLYADSQDPQGWKALIAAAYNGVTLETPAFQLSSLETEEFKKKSPLGRSPILEANDGILFEANAIARHVARQGRNRLYGNSLWEMSTIDNWIEFSENEVDLPGNVWIFPILGYILDNPAATQRAKADIRKALDALNKHLTTRTFLVGQRISLADIVVSMSFHRLYQRVLDPGFRKQFSHVNRWFLTCVNQPEFKGVIGETKLCEKMEIAPKAPVESSEHPKKEKPKKQEKAPEKKPEEKPEPSPEEDEFGEEKSKKKNPLDFLPPSTFDLEEWKRVYSNKDTRSEAIPWFWSHFDPSGFSIWFGDYKYSDEQHKLLMTVNLLGGYIQRLDKLRKYGFGSLVIFGSEPTLSIAVCFLVRGQEIPPELSECDDSENYTWRRADVSNPNDRELINDFWAWDGKFGGRTLPFNQGKIFK